MDITHAFKEAIIRFKNELDEYAFSLADKIKKYNILKEDPTQYSETTKIRNEIEELRPLVEELTGKIESLNSALNPSNSVIKGYYSDAAVDVIRSLSDPTYQVEDEPKQSR